ncbi:MAG: 30S ribosomal protein S20 [Alphaproteobacteria bacterium]|jgi:small subunit ribosomal protein S20|uniref:30S ribosomal protein S20 n=1 Tax=Pacificispira sp. TaxID=2888761 RepID=UPI001B02B2AF|nr:30S ribosomal protein S20 [Alphaproteobacteria bacterium]MBO6861062.1 30S ribosomal protein S20 [Alphaproteobacteria bacterium]MEC9267289.1 30S ribosomal protein S20 [Pseudomonadota bacterium]
MANHASALKRIRQTKKRTDRNMARRNRVRTFVRRVEEAIASGDKEAAEAAFKVAMPELHRSASKGVMRKDTASRKISRLAHRVKAVGA